MGAGLGALELGCEPVAMTVRDLAQARPAPRAPAPWGMLAAIDLHGCDRVRLADPDSIRRCVPAVIAAIGMRAHGPLAIDRFGDGELEGWSAMQFIETSSITVHADEVWQPLLRRHVLVPDLRSGSRGGGGGHALRRRARRPRALAMTEAVLGVLAGVIGVADTIPYVRDILAGRTRPYRGTWLIWGVLAVVVCLSQRADGASWSLVMAAVQAVLTGSSSCSRCAAARAARARSS